MRRLRDPAQSSSKYQGLAYTLLNNSASILEFTNTPPVHVGSDNFRTFKSYFLLRSSSIDRINPS